MRFVKQHVNISIQNNDVSTYENNRPKRHSSLLPNNIRGLLIAPSGGGKTNLLLSLITDKNGIEFENIYLYCKTMEQPKYKYLNEVLRPIKDIGFYTFTSSDDVIETSKYKKNSLIVFDDVQQDSELTKNVVRGLFSTGRHRNLDLLYLAQSYTRLPKNIRNNSNFIAIFKINEVDMKYIFSEFSVGSDMSFTEFRNFCFEAWRKPFGFACISLEHDRDSGRYRKNLDEYLHIGNDYNKNI